MIKLLTSAALCAILLISCGDKKPVDTTAGKTTASTTTASVTGDDARVVRVSVPTMQCESCVKTITGAVKKLEGVENVDVKLDQKAVFVTVANRTPQSIAAVETAIANAGYSTDTKQRDAGAYESLPDCCREGGMEKK